MDTTNTTRDAVHNDSKMNDVCKPNVQECPESSPSADDVPNSSVDPTIIVTCVAATETTSGSTSDVQDKELTVSLNDPSQDKHSDYLVRSEETSSTHSDDKMSPSPSASKHIMTDQDQCDSIPVPPPVPKLGVSVLAHKLWIGNLDKRLTE